MRKIHLETIALLDGEIFELIRRLFEYNIKYADFAPIMIESSIVNGIIKVDVWGTLIFSLPEEDKLTKVIKYITT